MLSFFQADALDQIEEMLGAYRTIAQTCMFAFNANMLILLGVPACEPAGESFPVRVPGGETVNS